jgi:hypothetical protein
MSNSPGLDQPGRHSRGVSPNIVVPMTRTYHLPFAKVDAGTKATKWLW